MLKQNKTNPEHALNIHILRLQLLEILICMYPNENPQISMFKKLPDVFMKFLLKDTFWELLEKVLGSQGRVSQRKNMQNFYFRKISPATLEEPGGWLIRSEKMTKFWQLEQWPWGMDGMHTWEMLKLQKALPNSQSILIFGIWVWDIKILGNSQEPLKSYIILYLS